MKKYKVSMESGSLIDSTNWVSYQNVTLNVDGTISNLPPHMRSNREGLWENDGQFYWFIGSSVRSKRYSRGLDIIA